MDYDSFDPTANQMTALGLIANPQASLKHQIRNPTNRS